MGNALGVFRPRYRRGGFYNRREADWMLLLNLNVRDLILWNQQNGEPFFPTTDSTEGGIVIFASVATDQTPQQFGVRLRYQRHPLPGSINVSPTRPASPWRATGDHVLGDFNRHGGRWPRQPAQRWRRRQHPRAALGIAGCALTTTSAATARPSVSPTSPNAQHLDQLGLPMGSIRPRRFRADYNGGLENYPRFHEDWAGFNLTYSGSFVSLGEPEHVDGPWRGTGAGFNIYNPPVRLWNFEPGYNNAANLPPLTPRFVYVQQVLFTEDFK
jgi:hypothetical protein